MQARFSDGARIILKKHLEAYEAKALDFKSGKWVVDSEKLKDYQENLASQLKSL